jgi:two-component system sensor histidine kinase RegB
MTRRASLSFLRLLCNLRWLAVLGQGLTVAVVVGVLNIPLPVAALSVGIAALAHRRSLQRKLAKQPGPERKPYDALY